MIRAVVGLLLAELGWLCARAAERCVGRPKPVLTPPPATLVPHPQYERYVRELVRIDLVRADGVLGFVLGCPGSLYYAGHFPKTPDMRWRQ